VPYAAGMPLALKRFHQSRQLHFITFTCYHRAQLLATPAIRDLVEQILERVRRWYDFCVYAYVIMPERMHLLISEPERGEISVAVQMLKQIVARKLGRRTWQRRYYDFNLWSAPKLNEKLAYIHGNPVRRGLVESPDLWKWSSFRHYATGGEGVVEIESEWTARKRERQGIRPQVKMRAV
jgi:putative transposase